MLIVFYFSAAELSILFIPCYHSSFVQQVIPLWKKVVEKNSYDPEASANPAIAKEHARVQSELVCVGRGGGVSYSSFTSLRKNRTRVSSDSLQYLHPPAEIGRAHV